MNGREYMGKVAQLPCAICGVYGVHVHHIRTGIGMGRRASDFDTMPLCPEHHQGNEGIHGLGVRGFYTRYKLDELDLLSMTIDLLMRGK